MSTGITFLENHPESFKDFQQNLKKGMCVTCGSIPLKHCDVTTGMCKGCQDSLETEEFDKLCFLRG